ncbi:MAG: hypothetical protein IPK69_08675 [Phycisphaerales bacterium]|nr:MAG: hypothetical protein IPK69_08675 [Phycisphaerales bacterium]
MAQAQPASFTDLGSYGAGSSPISTTGSLDAPFEVDWFRITITSPYTALANGILRIDTEGSLDIFDTDLGLFDSAGNVVAWDDLDGTGFLAKLSFGEGEADGTLAAGTYYLSVSDWESLFSAGFTVTTDGETVGSYNINVSTITPGEPPASTNLGSIGATGANNQTLTFDVGEIKWYSLTTTTPFNAGAGMLSIATNEVAGSLFNDSELGLYSAGGSLIATDDDAGPGFYSLLSFGSLGGASLNGDLPAGTFYLAVVGYNAAFDPFFTVTTTNAAAGDILLQITATPPPTGLVDENGDAGDMPDTALVPQGTGSLSGFTGSLGIDESDMFKIKICDTSLFTASTVGVTDVDTQLWLFNLDGTGVAFDDDAGPLQSALSNQFVTQTGDYYLAISEYDRDAIDNLGQAIWIDTPFATERAPDGAGAFNPIAAWESDALTTGGTYSILLTGACFPGPAIPDCVADTDDGSGTGTVDGAVTIDDLLYYITIFQTGAVAADVDNGTSTGTQDGAVTIDDLLYFIVRFQAGC